MCDELVKRLRNAAQWSDKGLVITPSICLEAAEAIEELSKENENLGKDLTSAVEMLKKKRKPKWIPVTERLPENGEYVLCFCRANIVCVLRRDKGGDWYENPTHVYMSGFVTHWMPLPEPPKEE